MKAMIVAASGRVGSTKKIKPSAGLGANETTPQTIPIITASPRARAVASTVPATSVGRAARTPIFHTVRHLLIPRPSDASIQPRGTARRPSEKTATITGAIITVRISTPAARP